METSLGRLTQRPGTPLPLDPADFEHAVGNFREGPPDDPFAINQELAEQLTASREGVPMRQ